jgi:YidC/Oxa1 family membrane protein insertase
VLIAPSWGEHALLETCGEEVIKIVLDAGYQVTLRPHPMTQRHRSTLLDAVEDRFRTNTRFRLDRDVASERSLYESDIMIGDWGGMSLEYAFGLERPVISIDLPRKVNNPEYERIPSEPIEVTLRSRVGEVVQPSGIDGIPDLIEKLCADPEGAASRSRALRERYIYNIGLSGSVGSEYIMEVISRETGMPA